eukprot:TRINITY_DN3622_c0_g2_i1.p1 TRINITY_DN3622_c0_g2~~TRINITY_DN3622_c0_g2_i1.p1  ORF type:complete len:196 (-),score=21.12 TRINITY_DN3622_c0_g2_i1:30-617(-)
MASCMLSSGLPAGAPRAKLPKLAEEEAPQPRDVDGCYAERCKFRKISGDIGELPLDLSSTAAVRYTTPSPRRRTTLSGAAPPIMKPKAPSCPFRSAISSDSADLVQQLLEEDPNQATLPFLDHDWEPPICYAARCACSRDLTSLLIKHGASWEDTDRRGRSAKELFLRATRPMVFRPPYLAELEPDPTLMLEFLW